MKSKKSFVIIISVLVVLIVGASVLYKNLSSKVNLIPNIPTNVSSTVESENETTHLAPDFTVYDKDGKAVKLTDYFGKPIVLNFWASWCGPCKAEMPDFDEKYKKYKDDVVFLMVNMTDGYRETVDSAQSFVESQGFSFNVLFDKDIDAGNTYQVYSFPTTYFIDKDGNLVTRAVGMMSAESLQRAIDLINK